MSSDTPHKSAPKLDRWADWLVSGRDRGATETQRAQTRLVFDRIRDRVLGQAHLQPGDRVLDVGAGSGLLALEARKQVGESGYVLALDISFDALSECRRQAEPVRSAAPLAYVVGDATHIPVASQSLDVVMTRSVLIYLVDKAVAVSEFHRVLRPGGRVSIYEPINEVGEQVESQVSASGFYDGLQPEWGEIRKRYDACRQEWWGPLLGWDERDLIGWFGAAGFSNIKVLYEYTSSVRRPWSGRAEIAAEIRRRPNPNMPSYEEIARAVLADRADDYLERYIRFILETGGERYATAYIYLLAER